MGCGSDDFCRHRVSHGEQYPGLVRQTRFECGRWQPLIAGMVIHIKIRFEPCDQFREKTAGNEYAWFHGVLFG